MSGDTEVPNLKPQESENAGITESGEDKGKKIKKRNFCYVCGVQCTCKKNFLAHQQGKKHLKKLGILQETEKQKQSLNEKQEFKQKQSLNKKKGLKQKQSLNKKKEFKQKQSLNKNGEFKKKQSLNKKQGFKEKQTLNKKQSLDKNKNNCEKINSSLDDSHETHEKNSSVLELSETTDIVSETELPSPNTTMNNPRRNSQKYQNHNHNDPGYQNNYNHRRYHNPRYSFYNNDYYHGNQGYFYNQPPGHSGWQGPPFPNGPYGYQGNGSNIPFNSGPFPESNLPFDSRQFQGPNIPFDPGNSTQPYGLSGNAFDHSGNEIMQEQMTYNENSTSVRNGNKSRSKEKGSLQDDNLADRNSSRNELNKSRDGYDLNSSTSTVENDTNPATTKANEGGEERLQTSPRSSSDSVRHKMSRWDKVGTKDKSERKSTGSSDSVRRRKSRWDKKDNSERKSVDSDSASEEQRVKEYTTSLLETNPSRLSQLIQHPSNYKEKAVLNHIMTSFSKTKRKESLTRKLRSNSLGSIGNNEDIALDTTSIMSENDEINKTTPLLETLGLMSSDLDQNVRKISPRKSRDSSKESSSESALNNEAPNNSSSPLPVSTDERAKKLRKSASKSKENSTTSKSKTYENRKEQTLECYVPDKLVKRKSSDCDSSIKSKKQKQVNEGVSVSPNSSNVAEEAERDLMDTPADNPLDDISNKQTNLESNAEEVPVKAEIAEFLTIAHSIEMNNAANSLVETPANPQNEALNFSSPLSVEHLIELFASGSVTVKREFNDPVIEALKAVDPNELLKACSPNNALSNKNAAENICPSADLNSRESELTSELSTTTRGETNSLNPVILGSVIDNDNITSVNVADRRNSGLSEKSLGKSKEPNSSSEQQSVDNALSEADTINLISKTKSEFPHLNKLIEDLLKISSEEEKVKENISEAKSKITEYSCLLEEWKNKKRKFHNEEEELRKKRNSIIQLMQNTIKQPSNPSNEPTPESQSKPISESPSLSGKKKANQKVDNVPKAKNVKKSSSCESPSLSGKNKAKQKVDKVRKAKNVEKSSSSSSSLSSSSSSSESSSESSSPERTPKKKKPNSSDSEEIIILPPPAKPNPPEIVIVDDTEETGIRPDASSSSNEGLSLFSLKKLNVHSTVVNSIVVFDDYVYTCSNDNTAKRFNLKDHSDTVTYFHTSKNVTEVVVEKVQNEALVFTSCSNKVLSLFIASNGTKIKTFFQVAVVQSICKGWGKFYAGLNDGTVNVYNWKYEEKEVVKSANPACRIATADQGRLHVLIILTSDGSVSLRDAETSLLIRCIKAYVKIPSWLTVHNDKAYLSSSDLSLFVVDVLSGKVEKKIYLNSHATGLAVSGDHIFNISYSGIINCINKDEITDKKLYYGAGKNGLTCIHIFQDWVFTGNRKGNISLFRFDPRSRADCRFNKCTYVFGSKEDLQFHVEKDHMLKKNLTRCYWANCPYVFPKGLTVQEKTDHMRGHFSSSRSTASYEH